MYTCNINIIQTDAFVFRNIRGHELEREVNGRFGGRKEKGELLSVYYTVKKKLKVTFDGHHYIQIIL